MDSFNNGTSTCTIRNIETVTVKQAALELGVDQATLRSWMRHNAIKIGIADRKEGKQKWNYTIYRTWLNEFIRSANVPTNND